MRSVSSIKASTARSLSPTASPNVSGSPHQQLDPVTKLPDRRRAVLLSQQGFQIKLKRVTVVTAVASRRGRA
jgi:hypothetical protein